MGTLYTISAPAPALYVAADRPSVANAYFAVTVDAAVDLSAAREYRDLPRQDRLSKAHAEQRGFLDRFFDPALGAALDLRIMADPAASTPLSVAVLGRVWGSGADAVAARAQRLRTQVHAAMPRHVTAAPVEDADDVARLLSPFDGASLDSAVITRRELLSLPSRPDAGVSYYYSALPFTWSDDDWSAVYGALAASPVPVVLSVAVLPMQVPAPFSQTMLTLATFYGRLAREGETAGGPYHHGRQRLAPDPFAVDAEQAFVDYTRRLSQKAFALRIQVSAAKQLPAGIAETIAGAISPGDRAGGLPEHPRASSPSAASSASGCDVRRPASVAERWLAKYNLDVINFGMLTGRPEIWSRLDPPDPQLAMLSVLGDARDAACAFRFPVAADGSAPGFRVRRGQGQRDGAAEQDGPAIRLGTASGAGRDVTIPLRSLARHALITGSAGSGTTSTALELLRQLWAEHQVPFLVIEPANSDAGDYRKLAAEPGFESLEVVTAGDEGGAPLRFNPFQVPAGMLVGEHAARLLACFDAAFGLPGPLSPVYRDALDLTYLRSGFLASERPAAEARDWPTVAEFATAMAEVTGNLRRAGEAPPGLEAASVWRARRLAHGTTGSVLLTDRPGDFGRLLDHPVIIELRSLPAGDEQALVMALLLNAVTEHRQAAHRQSARSGSPGLAHVTLAEEAHRLLARSGDGPPRSARAREKAAGSLARTLAESRGHGECVIFAERFPARLAAEAVKGTGLQVIHRLTAEDDRRYLGEVAGLDEAQRLSVARLRTGEALVRGDAFAEADQASVARTLSADAPPPGVVQPAVRPPFAACDRCRAQCAYRGAALSMLSDPVLVKDVTDAAGRVTRTGTSPAEQQDGLTGLREKLQSAVARFTALPATEPGRSDAAYCLFLHVHASSALRARPAWPAVAASVLGIAEPDGEPADGTGSAQDGALRAAAGIAGQPEHPTDDRDGG